jgi:phenylacetate-CoA ligase
LFLLPKTKSEEMDHRVRSYLQAKLRVIPIISYVTAEMIQQLQFPNAGRKPVKFVDKRKA